MKRVISFFFLVGTLAVSNFCSAEGSFTFTKTLINSEQLKNLLPKYQGSLSAVVNLDNCIHAELNPTTVCQAFAKESSTKKLEELMAQFHCSLLDPKQTNPEYEYYYSILTYPSSTRASLVYAIQQVSCLSNPGAQPQVIEAGLFSPSVCGDPTVKCDYSWVDLSSRSLIVYLHDTVSE